MPMDDANGLARGSPGGAEPAAEGSTPQSDPGLIPPDPRARASTSGLNVVSRRILSHADSPKSIFVTIDLLVALCIIALTVGFVNPTQRSAPEAGAFRQEASFTYNAPVIAPTAVYPSGFVTTGDPIYSGLVNKVIVHFSYHFSSALAHRIKGTIEVRALLLSQTDTWQQLATVSAPKAFTGDSATTVSAEGLDGLYGLINSVSTQSGNADASYTADIQLIVHVTGKVAGKDINTTFSPVVPFSVTRTTISVAAATTAIAPGATYVPPSASQELAATLNPQQFGTIPHLVPNFVVFAKHSFKISALRVSGLFLAVLAAVLIATYELYRRRTDGPTKEELVVARANTLMVPVELIPASGGVVRVREFTDLVNLAQFLEQPILFEEGDGQPTYVVDDETHRYIHQPEVTPQLLTPNSTPEQLLRRSRATTPSPVGPGRGKSFLLRGTGGLVVLLAVVLAVTSFAASNNVPASNVGTSNQLLKVAQLTPSGCATLTLSSLLIHSGTFSNASAHTLILAGAGADTITDTGADNCIVAGGGTNTLVGTASDICVSGPSLNVATPCPTSTTSSTTTTLPVSNGVAVSSQEDNYVNYGGQERLIISNVNAITALRITITVAQTQGITYASQSNGFPGGVMNVSWSNPVGSIVYVYALASGQNIPSAYPDGEVYAQYAGTGSLHAQTGDAWSVTSTSGGVVSTLTGVF